MDNMDREVALAAADLILTMEALRVAHERLTNATDIASLERVSEVLRKALTASERSHSATQAVMRRTLDRLARMDPMRKGG